jgi:putative DNA primase/helicase
MSRAGITCSAAEAVPVNHAMSAFLRAVLAAQGVYFAVTIDDASRVTHKACASVDELAATLTELDGRGLSVYHACATYKESCVRLAGKPTFRRRDNVRALKAFWLDLDVGTDNANKYPGQLEAAQALVDFCRAASLPRPLVVNSGNGLHAYWPVTLELSLDEWRPVAERLKYTAAALGLRADPTRTADPCSILRPVGTTNRKNGALKSVTLVREAERETSIADFANALDIALAGRPTLRPAGSTDALPSINASFELPPTKRAPGPLAEAERARIQAALRTVPADEYDTWVRIGLALKSTGDDSAFILWDQWSQNSLKYAGAGMRSKWESFSQGGGIGLGTLFQIAQAHGYVPAPVEVEQLTDVGNASRLVRLFGENLRYVERFKKWLIWDGVRWAFDDERCIERLAVMSAKTIYHEAMRETDGERRKLLVRHALQSEGAMRIESMIKLARSHTGVPRRVEQLDCNPWLLNVRNGTLDLRTATLRPARRDDSITKLAGVAFDIAAQCPAWEAFVLQVMDGNRELYGYIQRALGYCLTGSTSEQVMFVLYGHGANGKTTLLNTVRTLLGDYAMSCPAETLMVKREGGISNDIARLRGARFVAASETEDGHRLAESLVKQLTGGDVVTARFLHQEFFDFTPEFKILLAANHKPIIQNNDHGIWRRIHLIPFEVTFPESARDRSLPGRLLAELPGILNWMLDGLRTYLRDGLALPGAVRAATDQYRSEMDVIGQWVDEHCVRAPDASAPASALYTDYSIWAKLNGRHAVTSTRFGQKLAEHGFAKVKSSTIVYRGITLRSVTPTEVRQ